jgi:hypothetical protein
MCRRAEPLQRDGDAVHDDVGGARRPREPVEGGVGDVSVW